MDLETGLRELRARFKHYVNYVTAHPEFGEAHKPMFILALGVGTGSKLETYPWGLHKNPRDIPLNSGYLRPSVEAMVKGVFRDGELKFEPYTPERYQHKYISFVLCFDNEFVKHSYQYEFFENFKQANPELYHLGYYSPRRLYFSPEKDLPDTQEPLGVAPLSPRVENEADRYQRHVLHDRYYHVMEEYAKNPYKKDAPPDFYNIVCVNDYLPTPHRNTNASKHISLRNNGVRTFNSIIAGCDVEASYPLMQIHDILESVIAMGGVIGVQNDAYWMTSDRYGQRPENYYFENMCEIPKILSEFPPAQVYRFEMDVKVPDILIPRAIETFKATPFFSSIPAILKKFTSEHKSTRTQRGFVATHVDNSSTINERQKAFIASSAAAAKGHWEGERWVPNARRGGANRRRFTKRRSNSLKSFF